MKKLKIDYVFSGTSMLKLTPQKRHECEVYRKNRYLILKDCVKHINANLNDRLKYLHIDFSILYNAYLEPKFGVDYSTNDKVGFNKLYADSGGLQVITQGKTLNDEIKNGIYSSQDLSDICFCFDEIPVEKINENEEYSSGNRASVSSKLFNQKRLDECAKKTAENVLEQLEKIKNSKISYIIQGNTHKEMVRWFTIASEVLGEDNIKKLHGIALADTCMGNGILETCDMLLAAHEIFKQNPSLKKNLHLLGVGSSKRMLPAVLLMKSGFLKDVVLSSDSSSQSMSFVLGKTININSKKGALSSYIEFCTEMEPVYKSFVPDYDIEEFAKFILANNRQAGALEEICYDKEHKYHKIGFTVCGMYSLWCTNKLFMDIEKYIDNGNDLLHLLLDIDDAENYLLWRANNYSKLNTKRMVRNKATLI